MPAHDVTLYMHQVRPLRPGRSVTLFHDTIQLHFGDEGWKRATKHASHRLVARLSTTILTVSEYSRKALARDLSLDAGKLGVVRYPVDTEFVERVRAIRGERPAENRILYVGQYAPHKNLERLIAAFGRTAFAGAGGELRLVGGTEDWQQRLRRVAGLAAPEARVTVDGSVSQRRLEELYATSRVLAMPSLEEGFGLPAWEALSLGMPVCASRAGSLPEVTKGCAALCDPLSVPDIARALDEAAQKPWGEGIKGPTMADFAWEFVGAVEAAIEPASMRTPEDLVQG
jgi:glycosyltransferase involved in cell wall biosynthesis